MIGFCVYSTAAAATAQPCRVGREAAVYYKSRETPSTLPRCHSGPNDNGLSGSSHQHQALNPDTRPAQSTQNPKTKIIRASLAAITVEARLALEQLLLSA